ncbi:M56 family metallopeptidase [Chryseobacterium sp. C-71]|uniref:M56 family metallopeptidase n=1 Tax=Chryseobacterium sp. C-71 TaxID=2893882 RepID=UPI001E3D5C48|nr:M56 family metallopeptidase [Chryseobacterium sp. C-71]UFH30416.1 M56 family metallopeptidase [Chryseobacterium sp. C-71]
METIILKIILCSGIVLGLYYLFLAKEKTLTFNRFYLLLGLIFSYTIPFVTIKTKEIVKDKPVLLIEQESPIQILQDPDTVQAETFDYTQLLLIIYFVISGILIAKILYSILKIKTLKGRKIIYQNRNVVLLEKEISPFSFLNTIYLSEKYFKDQKIDERIFLHEEIHVKQKHSFDVLLIEIIKAFSWFNPFIYFYKNVMITNHEFLADEEVIIKNENIKNYQELILNEVLKQQNFKLTHQFNFNNTKKRFIMMTKRNSKFAEAKKYLAIPLFIVLAGFFVEKVYAKDSLSKVSGKSEGIFAEEDPYIEFNKIIKKYGNLIELKKYAEFEKTVSLSDREKLKDLYFQLTKEQRDATPFYFFNIKKSEKINVTQNQLNDFKNSKKYGLWIDGKKTKNQDLQNYKPEDFSHQSVSKRYPNAISAKNPEPYQVNLMTHQYFQNYQNEKEKTFMGFKAKAFIKGKDTITPRKNVDAKLIEIKKDSDKSQNTVLDISTAVEGQAADLVPAEFPGGANLLRKLVSGNFNGSVLSGNEGSLKSVITFIVDENGKARDIKTSGDNEKFNNEAYIATKLANQNVVWKPATLNGKPVAYQYKIPLSMTFETFKKTQ